MELIAVVITLAFILLAVSGVAIAHKQRISAWQSVAEELGLEFDEETIYGVLDGVAVQVRTDVRGSGRNRQTFTTFSAELDPNIVPLGLQIGREGLFSKVGKLVGIQDIQVGIRELDNSLTIRGFEPDEVKRWAQRPDVSRGLADILALSRSIEIETHEARVEFTGAVGSRETVVRTLDTLAHAARALSGKGYGALVSDEW